MDIIQIKGHEKPRWTMIQGGWWRDELDIFSMVLLRHSPTRGRLWQDCGSIASHGCIADVKQVKHGMFQESRQCNGCLKNCTMVSLNNAKVWRWLSSCLLFCLIIHPRIPQEINAYKGRSFQDLKALEVSILYYFPNLAQSQGEAIDKGELFFSKMWKIWRQGRLTGW